MSLVGRIRVGSSYAGASGMAMVRVRVEGVNEGQKEGQKGDLLWKKRDG